MCQWFAVSFLLFQRAYLMCNLSFSRNNVSLYKHFCIIPGGVDSWRSKLRPQQASYVSLKWPQEKLKPTSRNDLFEGGLRHDANVSDGLTNSANCETETDSNKSSLMNTRLRNKTHSLIMLSNSKKQIRLIMRRWFRFRLNYRAKKKQPNDVVSL